jgi:hypothetical protein
VTRLSNIAEKLVGHDLAVICQRMIYLTVSGFHSSDYVFPYSNIVRIRVFGHRIKAEVSNSPYLQFEWLYH